MALKKQLYCMVAEQFISWFRGATVTFIPRQSQLLHHDSPTFAPQPSQLSHHDSPNFVPRKLPIFSEKSINLRPRTLPAFAPGNYQLVYHKGTNLPFKINALSGSRSSSFSQIWRQTLTDDEAFSSFLMICRLCVAPQDGPHSRHDIQRQIDRPSVDIHYSH